MDLERSRLEHELAEAERECARYQQLFESEQKFIQIAADKDKIMILGVTIVGEVETTKEVSGEILIREQE